MYNFHMILLIHIAIALGSLAYATYTFFTPSLPKLRINYALIAATLASGTLLIISSHASVLHSCLTGFIYIGAVSAALYAAQRKLAHQETIQ